MDFLVTPEKLFEISPYPLGVPEILLHIFGFLDEWDLRKVKEVSKLWNVIANEVLSEKQVVVLEGNEEDTLELWINRMESSQEESDIGLGQAVLRKLIIHNLNLSKYFPRTLYATFAENLTELKLTGMSRGDCHFLLSTFSMFLTKLVILSVSIDTYSELDKLFDEDGNPVDEDRIVASSNTLQILKIHVARRAGFTFWPIVFKMCPALEELWISKDDDEATVQFIQSCRQSYTRQPIKKLCLDLLRSSYSQSIVVPAGVILESMALIRLLPLSDLRVFISGMELEAWNQLFSGSPGSLKKLILTSDLGIDLGMIPDSLALTELSLDYFFGFMEHLPLLQAMHLRWKGYFDMALHGINILPAMSTYSHLQTLIMSFEVPGCTNDSDTFMKILCEEMYRIFPKLLRLEIYDGLRARSDIRTLVQTLSNMRVQRLAISKVDCGNDEYLSDFDLFGESDDVTAEKEYSGIQALNTLKELLLETNCDQLTEAGIRRGIMEHPSLKIMQFSHRIPCQLSRPFISELERKVHLKIGQWHIRL